MSSKKTEKFKKEHVKVEYICPKCKKTVVQIVAIELGTIAVGDRVCLECKYNMFRVIKEW